MSELIVRRLLIDLEAPFPLRWCGGDAFRSALFNALSFSFPAGEQYFIDSVRRGLDTVPPEQRALLAVEVQGFVGQEATHRRVHSLFNAHLEKLGIRNRMEMYAHKRLAANAHVKPRNHVAATAATEHLTAIFAEWVLRNFECLDGAEQRFQTLWRWHAAEESEHRGTAFDVYKAMGGNHHWRVKVFYVICLQFAHDVLCQTLAILWRDKALWRYSTWRSAWRVLFAKDGLIRGNVGLWRDYLREDFHPHQHGTAAPQQWLRDNASSWRSVG